MFLLKSFALKPTAYPGWAARRCDVWVFTPAGASLLLSADMLFWSTGRSEEIPPRNWEIGRVTQTDLSNAHRRGHILFGHILSDDGQSPCDWGRNQDHGEEGKNAFVQAPTLTAVYSTDFNRLPMHACERKKKTPS